MEQTPKFQATCQQSPHMAVAHVELHPVGDLVSLLQLHAGADLYLGYRQPL